MQESKDEEYRGGDTLPSTAIRIRSFALITRNPSQATLSRARSPGSARELRVSGVNGLYHFGTSERKECHALIQTPPPFHSLRWEVGGGREHRAIRPVSGPLPSRAIGASY